MPKEKVQMPITDQEVAFAQLLLAGGLTDREAAQEVGIRPAMAAYTKAKPRVQEYLTQHRESVSEALAQHEADALASFNIGRVQMLNKWWEFANIDPAKTGYNTSSQSKALESLWKVLGFDVDSSKKSREQESQGTGADDRPVPRAAWMKDEPAVYVSAWMREKVGQPKDNED